ncbi:MAG: type transporter, partial [Acidimicrobiia bacterium]|nr:type transporter [Acidimicrobiia bacterium]
AEPLLYLLSIGLGVGALVGGINVEGQLVPYRSFIAPGLLALTAMNGAIIDTTFNFFVKFKYMKTYDAVLATPLAPRDVAWGEVSWAVGRATVYSTAFLLTMVAFGLVESWWAVLAVPAAMLVGFSFAGAGIALSTWMRSFIDFDLIFVAITPMFLFSGTFFPITRYPGGAQLIVRATPLYQGVALERALTLGHWSWVLPLHALYLLAVGLVGVRIGARRVGRLLQS